jgi:aldehyde dehydrogenase (NAD+)
MTGMRAETARKGMVMGEVRMLIDGELIEAASGKRFDNINPSTEEVIGEVADADPHDMARGIAAARRAFDDTDWSTNKELRTRCLQQLQDAVVSEREELRQELVEEVGTPLAMTFAGRECGREGFEQYLETKAMAWMP